MTTGNRVTLAACCLKGQSAQCYEHDSPLHIRNLLVAPACQKHTNKMLTCMCPDAATDIRNCNSLFVWHQNPRQTRRQQTRRTFAISSLSCQILLPSLFPAARRVPRGNSCAGPKNNAWLRSHSSKTFPHTDIIFGGVCFRASCANC